MQTWDEALGEAFGILLGRPLGEFDAGATYAVHYSCGDLASELFQKGFDAAVAARGEIVGPPFTAMPVLGSLLAGWDMIAPHWSIDLGRSVFRAADPGDGAEAGVAELDRDGGVTGVELGRILAERGLTPKRVRRAYPEIEFRVHTDGSLADAMRHATGTMRGPEHLFALSPAHGVDPGWDAALGVLPDAGLRDHLRHLCRDEDSARSDGACYLGAEDPGLQARRPDGTAAPVLAAWQVGEAQSWTAVVSLG